MKAWMTKGLELLKASLEPPKQELNELDWKAALSPDKKRLTEHLSALSNQAGGGYLVFGVDSAGTPAGVDRKTVETTVNQLANLGRAGLEPPVVLDHSVQDFESVRLLFVHVPESAVKPVHLRGKGLEDAFIRSGGTTRKASRQEIGTLMLNSRTPRWEELRASVPASGHGPCGQSERRAHSEDVGTAGTGNIGRHAGLDGGRTIHRTRTRRRWLHNEPRGDFVGAEARRFSRPEPQGGTRGGLRRNEQSQD